MGCPDWHNCTKVYGLCLFVSFTCIKKNDRSSCVSFDIFVYTIRIFFKVHFPCSMLPAMIGNICVAGHGEGELERCVT